MLDSHFLLDLIKLLLLFRASIQNDPPRRTVGEEHPAAVRANLGAPRGHLHRLEVPLRGQPQLGPGLPHAELRRQDREGEAQEGRARKVFLHILRDDAETRMQFERPLPAVHLRRFPNGL